MMFSVFAASALSASLLGAPHVGPQSARDALLVTPAPYPAHRVDSPARAENGRLWVSRWPIGTRTPITEEPYTGRLGPGAYGAPFAAIDDRIVVRVVNTSIAINPWLDHNRPGLQRFEAARTQWLREQGYIQKVRTHVNPLHHRDDAASMYARTPTPRATIQIHDELPRRPYLQRVEGPVSSQPITRISRPHAAPDLGPIRVITDEAQIIVEADEPGVHPEM